MIRIRVAIFLLIANNIHHREDEESKSESKNIPIEVMKYITTETIFIPKTLSPKKIPNILIIIG